MKLLDKYQPAFTTNERVYYTPIASKQNMEKLSVSKFFSFIAGVVDMVINIYIHIYSRIVVKIKMAPFGYSRPWGGLICEKKQKLKISCQTPLNENT
jgi:hypothetical protein